MTSADQPRFRPAPTADRVINGVRYVMTQSELSQHGHSKRHHDTVFRAVVKRVDGIVVTTHVIHVGVDNHYRSAALLQDADQPHAKDLLAIAMTDFVGRHADERC